MFRRAFESNHFQHTDTEVCKLLEIPSFIFLLLPDSASKFPRFPTKAFQGCFVVITYTSLSYGTSLSDIDQAIMKLGIGYVY